jgi:RNA polymerase sigma-70 factor (ECF subfamily)
VTVVPTRRAVPDVPAVTDAVLLAAVARDDLGALGVLYDRHAASVWRVIHRVTNGANDVDDIVHATFLKLPALAASFDGRPSARSWLAGIAVRVALRHRRSLGRLAATLRRFAEVTRDADSLDPELLATGRARLAVLDRAVRKLSAAKRAVFVLVEIEGCTHEEVARDLGIPLATVRTRLFSAKRELRTALTRAEAR